MPSTDCAADFALEHRSGHADFVEACGRPLVLDGRAAGAVRDVCRFTCGVCGDNGAAAPPTRAPTGAPSEAPGADPPNAASRTESGAPVAVPSTAAPAGAPVSEAVAPDDAEEVAVRDGGQTPTDEEHLKMKNKTEKKSDYGGPEDASVPDDEVVVRDGASAPTNEEPPKTKSKKEKPNDGDDDTDDTQGSVVAESRSAILGEGTDDNAQASVADKMRSWWDKYFTPSDDTGSMFTPFVIGLISAGGVFLVTLLCCCLSRRRRRRLRRRSKVKILESKKRRPTSEVNIEQPGETKNMQINNFTRFKQMYEIRRKRSKMSSAPEGNVQPSNSILIDEETACGLNLCSAPSIFGGPGEEVGKPVQPKESDSAPVILIPVVVEDAGLLGIRLSSTCPFACVEKILPAANVACRKLQPGDVLAPYQPASAADRTTPYTQNEFMSLVASNKRPLRFAAVRSAGSSAVTTVVVDTDTISDEITM